MPIAYVKSAQTTVGTTVTSISLPYSIAIGDFVVLTYSAYVIIAGNPGTISDDGGNTYTPRITSLPAGATGSYLYTMLATSPATTITVLLTGTQNTNGNTLIASTYSGVGSVGITGTNGSTTATTSASTSGTLASSNSWMVTNFAVRGTVQTATSGTIRQNITGGGRGTLIDFTGSTSGLCAVTWTSTSVYAATFVELIPAVLIPSLSSMSPNTAAVVNPRFTVIFHGTNLTGTTAVNVGGAPILVSNISVINSTTVTANFSIPQGASTGTFNISLTTPSGTSNTLPFTLTLRPSGQAIFYDRVPSQWAFRRRRK